TKERTGFNLAPNKRAVQITLEAPSSQWQVHAWLILAAFAGQDITISHSLLNDHELTLLRALSDLGATVKTHEDTISLRMKKACQALDLSIHVGSNFDTFALLAGQYIVRPSRIRFTAEGNLKTVSLFDIARFLPSIGARLSFVVPKTNGFPIRIECSGDLPNTITIPDQLPRAFVEGLLLALPFAEHPVCLDISQHTEKASICERCLPLLEKTEATCYESKEWNIVFEPHALTVPEKPVLPCEESIACALLSLPLLLGGEVTLHGGFPNDSQARDVLAALSDLGLAIEEKSASQTILAHASHDASNKQPALPSLPCHKRLMPSLYPLLAGLLAGLALQEKKPLIPDFMQKDATTNEFFSLLRLECNSDAELLPEETSNDIPVFWNAPSPYWAIALALAACARRKEGFKLGNAGIITDLWPQFWTVYNALPVFQGRSEKNATQEKPQRRKIRTDVALPIPKPSDAERESEENGHS
ncbi:MAG: hypothetical protein J5803_00630, partial [Desulfovibrio sp.]|nr:hypothetical protein [Desulfovibrio sp.]